MMGFIVFNFHLSVLLSDPSPHKSLGSFIAQTISECVEEILDMPPDSCPFRRGEGLHTLADTQVGLPEE